MKNKAILSILISAKFATSSVNDQTPKFLDIYDKLSYQNIMVTFGEVSDDFTLHNINSLAAFVQGTNVKFQALVKGLKPYAVFNKFITPQSLPADLKARFFSLPNMPQAIKETTENLCVYVFAFASEAFGKEDEPHFIYATRPAKADDVIIPLRIEDFNYTDSLTQYRQTCSKLGLFPNHDIQDNNERLNILKDLADIGIIDAQFNCGCMLDKGEGVLQDKAEAFKYFKLAADQWHATAQFNCGMMLRKGEVALQDKAEAIKYFKSAADQGHVGGQFIYAIMLLNGDGILQDKAEAFKYFQLAADQGHVEALFECAKALGNFSPYYDAIEKDEDKAAEYYKEAYDRKIEGISKIGDTEVHKHFMERIADKGTADDCFRYAVFLHRQNDAQDENNINKVFLYYKKSADQGHGYAQINCGQMLYEGKGVERNLHESINYYEMAEKNGFKGIDIKIIEIKSELGVAEDCFKYAEMVFSGYIFAQNYEQAFHYYKLAADQGHRDAQFKCGLMLYSGEGVSQDKEEAFEYFKSAVAQEHRDAQFNCGVMLLNGEGVSQDKAEALKYFKSAADQGYRNAQFHCGVMLYSGEGVSQDKVEALKYFKSAADQGHRDAQFNCGVMLLNGEGGSQNKEEAFEYFNSAAGKGHVLAKFKCGNMLYFGKGILKNSLAAFEYFKSAAGQGHRDAQFNCGFMLDKGEGVLQDKIEAFKYYKLAADQGHTQALLNYEMMLSNGEGVLQDKAQDKEEAL